MRHRHATKKLDRPTSQRRLLLRNLANSLILAERLQTTTAKAKWLRPFIERLVTMAKQRALSSRRRALQLLDNKKAMLKLVDELGVRFQKRPGGYTRIVRIGPRRGDGADQAVIEFVERPAVTSGKKEKSAVDQTKNQKGDIHDKKA